VRVVVFEVRADFEVVAVEPCRFISISIPVGECGLTEGQNLVVVMTIGVEFSAQRLRNTM
jgi:hypothetical protein